MRLTRTDERNKTHSDDRLQCWDATRGWKESRQVGAEEMDTWFHWGGLVGQLDGCTQGFQFQEVGGLFVAGRECSRLEY